ncbi:cytochrome P450 [Mycena olivaceomarginata]|nr:cytochrome P450 [Mycena olivaceomarginata]
MDDLTFLVLCGVLAGVVFASLRKAFRDPKLDEIPVVGTSGFLSSYRDALNFLHNAPELIQRGYDLYPEGIFRVSRLFRYEYVVCGPRLIKDLGAASEHVVSFTEGVEETVQAKYTMGRDLTDKPYHLNAVRTSLTRNLHVCFPDVRDEIVCAFDDVLQLQGSEWKSLPVLPTLMAIVARVSNRLFVGLPLCRNQAYLANNVAYTLDVMRSANKIILYPPFLRPLVGPIISSKNQSYARALEFLGPLIEERLEKEKELGQDWEGKPNDFISWMLDIAEGDQLAAGPLTLRILSINMAAIHTTSMAFTQALFDLTTHPEYLLPMRKEAERVIKEEGWTKAALNSMVKIDSLLRESQRINTNGPIGMTRKVVAKEGFRFSNGVVLPQGAYVTVAAKPTHYDNANYENAATFDGFRFAREREAHMASAQAQEHSDSQGQDFFKRQMISTGVDHLPFGTGKHACPGRFFAATELKAIMAHIVLTYDVKAEVEGVRPPDNVFGTRITPNATGRVQFRKRQERFG